MGFALFLLMFMFSGIVLLTGLGRFPPIFTAVLLAPFGFVALCILVAAQ